MNGYIRQANADDSEEILGIYAPYVRDTAVSFEIEVPSKEVFKKRVKDISDTYPYLVYVADGKIVAYAYASRHAERAAYRYDVSVSVYCLPEYHGKGVAAKLYSCLFDLLKELGYYNAYASYTVPNEKSANFHKKFGFTLIGTHHKTGFKFGSWHDVNYLEKTITDHTIRPENIKGIKELPLHYLSSIFTRHST